MYWKWNFLKNFTMTMVKMNFILWKIVIEHNFDWKYYVFCFLLGVHIYIYIYIYIYMCVCVCVCLRARARACIIKKRVCVYMCVGVVLININATTWPPLQTKISGFTRSAMHAIWSRSNTSSTSCLSLFASIHAMVVT